MSILPMQADAFLRWSWSWSWNWNKPRFCATECATNFGLEIENSILPGWKFNSHR